MLPLLETVLNQADYNSTVKRLWTSTSDFREATRFSNTTPTSIETPPSSPSDNTVDTPHGNSLLRDQSPADDIDMTPEQISELVRQAVADALGGQQPGRRQPDQKIYLDPNYEAEAVEVKEDKQIYHNVFSFTNRLRVKVTTMDQAILRQDIESSLLG
ncbi:hypothetical protein MMC16_007532 [Acarospora aff. strigata]|nr:hypothetical protein [Acarospora aff. strigata]